MSIAGFFKAARRLVKPTPATQHDLAIKAMTMVAEGAHRRQMKRAPKRRLYWNPVVVVVDWVKHRRSEQHVAIKRQNWVDGSRYPFAHDGGRAGDPNRRP